VFQKWLLAIWLSSLRRLKPLLLAASNGTAEAVPFPSLFLKDLVVVQFDKDASQTRDSCVAEERDAFARLSQIPRCAKNACSG
jgi:hypothetical protein